jgi:DNA polymerase-4
MLNKCESRQRTIFHIDMDAFFSAIEQRSNPSLKDKPVIVCGDPTSRSVVSTASYEARIFGVKSGMPVGRARRLCPHGIYISGNPKKYVYTSVRILGVLREFCPRVEPFSVDEAFLEFDNLGFEKAPGIAMGIKQRIRREFGLTCSIGIGPNKIVAKMASDLNKPDGVTLIREGRFLDFFGDKEVASLWGIGEKTRVKLRNIGIRNVKELAAFPESTLRKLFGEYGTYLKMTANGIDDSPVIPYYQGVEAKSIGHERTLSCDTSNRDVLLSTLLRLCEQVARRMRRDGYVADTVTVKIRYGDFTTFTRQKKLAGCFERDDLLYDAAKKLFLSNFNGDEVRLIGVSVSGLIKKEEATSDPLFTSDRVYHNCLEAVDSIRDRFGEDSIKRGGSIGTGM